MLLNIHTLPLKLCSLRFKISQQSSSGAMASGKDFISNLKSMESNHKPLLILRCKCVVVGDACVGKTAITQVFNSGGSTYPKNYVMV